MAEEAVVAAAGDAVNGASAAVPADDPAQAAHAALQAALAAAPATAAADPSAALQNDLQAAAASLGINLGSLDTQALLKQISAITNPAGAGAAAGALGADASVALRSLLGSAAGGLGGSATQQALADAASAVQAAVGGQPFNLLDGAAGALGQQLAATPGDALAALAAMQPGNALVASMTHTATTDPFAQLQSLGLKYQAFMDEKDTQLLDQARRTHNVMHLTVQVLQMPAGINTDSAVLPAVDLELPGAADLACLKRAVTRASAGLLPPHSQRYFVSETGQPMSGDSNLLLSWDLHSGSQLYLVVVEHEPAHSLRTFQVSVGDLQRLPAVASDEDGGDPDEGLRRLMSGHPDASDDGDDDNRRRKSGSFKKPRKEGDDGEGPTPRMRFTDEEITALVEGVRLFGTSWARIKSAFPTQLARRTQVNIKDKWRNLQRGLQTNWRDERSHLSEDTKNKIRELNEALTQQQYAGLPAGLPVLAVGGHGGNEMANVLAQAQQLQALQALQAAAAAAGAEAAPGAEPTM